MQKKEIIIWHELDGIGDTTLDVIKEICNMVECSTGFEIKLEMMNINDFCIRFYDVNRIHELPDIALIPQNMISNYKAGNFSVIPDEYRRSMSKKIWNTMNIDNMQVGIPYLQGNHAVMYYNTEFFSHPPTRWDIISNFEQLDIIKCSINVNEAFWVLPFGLSKVKTFGSKEIQYSVEKLQRLAELIKVGTVKAVETDEKMIESFILENSATIIAGEWVYKYLNEKMPTKLGVCGLPAFGEEKMLGITSTLGLVFPNNSLMGEKRVGIEEFIYCILSYEIQLKLFKDYKRIPVNCEIEIKKKDIENNFFEIYNQMQYNCFSIKNKDDKLSELWSLVLQDLKKLL